MAPDERQDWKERLGRSFARFATDRVVAHPSLWGVFRGPIRWQFERLARVWDRRRGPESLAPLAAAFDRIDPPASVLDLGTGTGKAARLAAERFPGAAIVGVDLAPGMVAEARSLLPPDLSGRVTFQEGDASHLGYADGEFDLVILLNMIPFFPELARVTAPGGAIVFAFSSAAGTPIYVPPATLKGRLAALGFEEFEEVAAGAGTALIARRPRAI